MFNETIFMFRKKINKLRAQIECKCKIILILFPKQIEAYGSNKYEEFDSTFF